MCPNTVLKNILTNARKVSRKYENSDDYSVESQLADDILALHSWLIAGGFLPNRWISRK